MAMRSLANPAPQFPLEACSAAPAGKGTARARRAGDLPAARSSSNAATTLPKEVWLATINCLSCVDVGRLARASRRSHQATQEAKWQFHEDVRADSDDEQFCVAYGTWLPDELLEAWVGTP